MTGYSRDKPTIVLRLAGKCSLLGRLALDSAAELCRAARDATTLDKTCRPRWPMIYDFRSARDASDAADVSPIESARCYFEAPAENRRCFGDDTAWRRRGSKEALYRTRRFASE